MVDMKAGPISETGPASPTLQSPALQKIYQEYGQICAALGEMEYRVHIFEAEKKKFLGRLKGLNREAERLSAKEAKEPAQKASVKE